MLLRTFLTLILGGAVCCTTRGTEPIDIGSRLELFVDDFLIERMNDGAELRLHRPARRELAFTCDKPWEGNWSGALTLFQDGAIYRMYYRGAQYPPTHKCICYTESNDGIH